jgi:formylmethanofuran dehydrogenase subunit A
VREAHLNWYATPRQVARALGVPNLLHIHAINLGVAGNIQPTLETINALEGLPATSARWIWAVAAARLT